MRHLDVDTCILATPKNLDPFTSIVSSLFSSSSHMGFSVLSFSDKTLPQGVFFFFLSRSGLTRPRMALPASPSLFFTLFFLHPLHPPFLCTSRVSLSSHLLLTAEKNKFVKPCRQIRERSMDAPPHERTRPAEYPPTSLALATDLSICLLSLSIHPHLALLFLYGSSKVSLESSFFVWTKASGRRQTQTHDPRVEALDY